jgi:hypothetical protein
VFSSQTKFSIEVNLPGEEEMLSADAWNPAKNEMMALSLGCILCFFLFFGIATYYDNSIARDDSTALYEKQFWRELNLMTQMRLEPRSWYNFRKFFLHSLKRRHVWISPIFRPRGDYMISQKRVLMLFVFLLNITTVAALFAGTEQSIPFLNSEVGLACVIVACSFPIPFAFQWIFTRSPPPTFIVALDPSRS